MNYKGTVKNGVVVLPPEVRLADGAEVEVTPLEEARGGSSISAGPSATGQAARLAGGLRPQSRPLRQGASQKIMKSVFADTFYFLALLNERDASHQRAVALSRSAG